ncbi:hypothetical protein LJC71_06795 [Desulfosarcina sp. OttesenSCG-928-A07]|nr:hypothetical protein [Desulfosarcina sp. OttesenSCG-928-G17]MDL2329432.1 hypothetical protein [Desulfosarcina sp. OttesenSCG-928-A07]
MYPRNKIDMAGKALAVKNFKSDDHQIDCEIVFDEYRRSFLQPLTNSTIEIQNWLRNFNCQYYIAQRLKRKPQILRKMGRISVRLTQLQDIGGNRIIVNSNKELESLRIFIKGNLSSNKNFSIYRETDYRIFGRDDTGYRSLHIILNAFGKKIELQLRSSAQHYWAECIERTSVIYGHYLKENDGDPKVIEYFKALSHAFYEIECGREPAAQEKISLDKKRDEAEKIIKAKTNNNVLHSYVNDNILHTLATIESKSSSSSSINNWILIFDWNGGHFVNWEAIPRDPNLAYDAYIKNEKAYAEESGYEVVLVGSSDVSMIRKTHSHYFGIDKYENILENLDQSVLGFSVRQPIDSGCRKILYTLMRKRCWGKRGIRLDTLKNHYCKSLFGVEASLNTLKNLDLVIMPGTKDPISLNIQKKEEINSYL